MLQARERKTAEHFGISTQIEKFKTDLLSIDGVEDVEFDLDGFWSDIRQVIFLPKYSIPWDNHYQRRRELLAQILKTATDNSLMLTGDRIEDYGQYFYIVTDCNWKSSRKGVATV